MRGYGIGIKYGNKLSFLHHFIRGLNKHGSVLRTLKNKVEREYVLHLRPVPNPRGGYSPSYKHYQGWCPSQRGWSTDVCEQLDLQDHALINLGRLSGLKLDKHFTSIQRTFRACGAGLTLHQVLMIDGGQVGEVLLEVGAELSMGVDLDQLLLASWLLPVEVRHVFLWLGADLGAAAADVVSTQHVLHHGAGGRENVEESLSV